MKKGISLVTVFLLLMMVALVVYLFVYFLPAQAEMTALRAELSVHTAEAAVYRQYINDVSPLEADIAAAQAELDDLHKNGYVNDSTVGMEINNAIQRYSISLKSISLDDITYVDGYRALPIYLTISGTYAKVMAFISHFENNTDGSYMVQSASLSTTNNNCGGSIVLYLCTPKK